MAKNTKYATFTVRGKALSQNEDGSMTLTLGVQCFDYQAPKKIKATTMLHLTTGSYSGKKIAGKIEVFNVPQDEFARFVAMEDDEYRNAQIQMGWDNKVLTSCFPTTRYVGE
jgi:hypothetical protein